MRSAWFSSTGCRRGTRSRRSRRREPCRGSRCSSRRLPDRSFPGGVLEVDERDAHALEVAVGEGDDDLAAVGREKPHVVHVEPEVDGTSLHRGRAHRVLVGAPERRRPDARREPDDDVLGATVGLRARVDRAGIDRARIVRARVRFARVDRRAGVGGAQREAAREHGLARNDVPLVAELVALGFWAARALVTLRRDVRTRAGPARVVARDQQASRSDHCTGGEA